MPQIPKLLFVDTGYVIALINKRDHHHAEALRIAEQYRDYRLVTTDAVLLEIGNALSHIARAEAVEIIREFQVSPTTMIEPITAELISSALSL